MSVSAATGLSRAPISEIILIFLQHFRPILAEANLTPGADEARELAGAIAAGRPHVKAEPATRAIAERVDSRLDALRSRWGMDYAASLRADMEAIGPWRTTAEFLALANDKVEAETDIALGSALLLAAGRREYARCLLDTLEHDAGALDVDAAIARRILLHVSGIDGAREGGLARLRRWLEDPPARGAGA